MSMKKNLVVGLFAMILALFIASCSKKEVSQKAEPVKKIQNSKWENEFKNAPAWVLNPESIGGLAAVGSAKIGKAGIQFARVEALANARDELARQISVKVKNMVKNFTQVTGVGDEESVDKVSVQVSKQITSQALQGSRQKDMWISPSGTLYVLVIVDPESVKELVKQQTLTSFKKDKALWQQFQAKKAYEELEKEIQKEFDRQ